MVDYKPKTPKAEYDLDDSDFVLIETLKELNETLKGLTNILKTL